MLEGKMGRRWLAGLVGLVALSIAAAVSADEGQIQGTLVSVPEAPVAVGEALQFSVEELDFELDLPVGEWWVMSGSAWTFEWIVDDRVEAVTDSHTWTPSDAAFADTGAYDVSCRVTFCYEIQYEEAGQPVSVGPHTAMALFEYPIPFEVVGLAEPLYYRYDGEETWAIAPPTLHVEPGAQLLFSVEPDGAAAFPLDEPVWTVAGATTATGSQQFAWQAPANSQGGPVTIAASCGAESLATAVQVVIVSSLEWKIEGSDGFFQAVPESGEFYVPAGVTVLFRAVSSPAGAPWPDGAPVWTGADPKQGGELPGRASAFVGTSPVTVQAAVLGQGDPADATPRPLSIESITLAGNGGTWSTTVTTATGTPAVSVPVGLQCTFSVAFNGHTGGLPAEVPESSLVWTGDGFPVPRCGPNPSTSWGEVSSTVGDRSVTLTFGNETWTIPLTAVGIEKIEYSLDEGASWAEADETELIEPFYSPLVRALPTPTGADFPPTFPTWSGIASGGAGTAAATPDFNDTNGNTHVAKVTASCGGEARCRLVLVWEYEFYPMVLSERVALEANSNDVALAYSCMWRYNWEAGGPPPYEIALMSEPGVWYLYKDFDDDATASMTVGDGEVAASNSITALEPGGISVWVRGPEADPADWNDPVDLTLSSVALHHLEYSIGPVDNAIPGGTVPDGTPLCLQNGTQLNLSAVPMGGGSPDLWPPDRPDWTTPVTSEDGVPTQSVRLDGLAQGGWYEARCGKKKDAAGTLQDCVDGLEVVVCNLDELEVEAAGLSPASRTDLSPFTEPSDAGNTLYAGPDSNGMISFTINVDWSSTADSLDPSHVKWAIEYPTTQGGWATATTGDDYQDGTFGGFWLPNGTPAEGNPVSGDMTDGNPIYVNWQLPRTTDYRLDTLRVRVWFDDTVKHEGTAHELCVPLTIVKPDMIIHRPKEADDNEPPISFENEEDPGLYLSVNDDWDSEETDAAGDPAPDNDDDAITGDDQQRAADRADMARLDLTALYALADCDGWSLRFSATGPGRVRLFREGENTQLWDSGSGPAVFAGLFEDLVRKGQSLYVEGIVPGEAVLTIEALDHGGNVVGRDVMTVTPVRVLLRCDSNNDGGLDASDDQVAHNWPGCFVRVNDDDDDENGAVDVLQNGVISNEDDLRRLEMSVLPAGLAGDVSLSLSQIDTTCLWETAVKGNQGAYAERHWAVADLPGHLFMEGLSPTTAGPLTVTLTCSLPLGQQITKTAIATVVRIHTKRHSPGTRYGFDDADDWVFTPIRRNPFITSSSSDDLAADPPRFGWGNKRSACWCSVASAGGTTQVALDVHPAECIWFVHLVSDSPGVATSHVAYYSSSELRGCVHGALSGEASVSYRLGTPTGPEAGRLNVAVYDAKDWQLDYHQVTTGSDQIGDLPAATVEAAANSILRQAVLSASLTDHGFTTSAYDIDGDGVLTLDPMSMHGWPAGVAWVAPLGPEFHRLELDVPGPGGTLAGRALRVKGISLVHSPGTSYPMNGYVTHAGAILLSATAGDPCDVLAHEVLHMEGLQDVGPYLNYNHHNIMHPFAADVGGRFLGRFPVQAVMPVGASPPYRPYAPARFEEQWELCH